MICIYLVELCFLLFVCFDLGLSSCRISLYNTLARFCTLIHLLPRYLFITLIGLLWVRTCCVEKIKVTVSRSFGA